MTDTATSMLSGAPSGEGSPTGASNAPWYGDLISKETDTDFKAYVTNKNYPDPLAAIKGHYNAEKLIGLDRAGRTVVLPKDDNDAEGMKAFRAKLGVPEKPEDYKLPFEGDATFAAEAQKWFHQAGVPAKAAQQIAENWNKQVKSMLEADEAARVTKNTQELNELKANLGNGFAAQQELSRRALNVFGKEAGFTDEDIGAMEDAIGSAKTVKLFMKLGNVLREAQFAGGDSTMGTPPDQIKAKIKEIQTARTANKYSEREWKETYLPQVLKLQEELDKA